MNRAYFRPARHGLLPPPAPTASIIPAWGIAPGVLIPPLSQAKAVCEFDEIWAFGEGVGLKTWRDEVIENVQGGATLGW